MPDKKIKIPAFDGDAFSAYIALPEITPAPAIIVIQEIFGINADIREKCDELAREGYIAIAPDLFWRIEPEIELIDSIEEQLQRAFELFGEFNQETGLEDLKTTLGYAHNMKECNGKVGAIGYCLGGKLAYMLSTASDIDASVSYYGVAIETMLGDKEHITTPLMLHIAGNDEYVPPEAQTQIITAFQNYPHVETHQYAGQDHAFTRINGTHYDESATALANNRTTTFLNKNLK
ncbi:MAG: dienelactone hydrolase family protein [Alphaproteobacteria bacterium]